MTVRLQPGMYYTRGFNTSYNLTTNGWRPKSGMRIIGSGLGTTTIKLISSLAANLGTAVVGNDHTDVTHFLDGFELSDVALDCSYGSPSAATRGVVLSGRNIYVCRVRVFNFGTASSTAKGSGSQFPARTQVRH